LSGYSGFFQKLMTRTIVVLLVFLLGINTFGFNLPKASADAGPDLIVQDITLSPPNPAIDESVTITVTIKNQGDASAGTSYVTCYIDDIILQTQSVSALDAGLMATATFSWQATEGTHTIRAVADSSDIITETDETNNASTNSLTTLASDLIVQSITWSPTNPSGGDIITFSIVVKNQGNAKSKNTNINFYIDGYTRGTQDIAAINPSASLTKTYSWTALDGQHELKAVVDETNNNKESDETNNELIVTFATGVADLAFQNVVWSPQNPSKYDTVTCNVTVVNQGQGRADTWYLAYFLDGTLGSTILGSSLEPEASANMTFSWQTLNDEHDIRIVLDYYNSETETDETNNEYTLNITTLVPDLIVSDISWLPINPGTGDNVTITVKIKNQGSGRAASSTASSYIDNHFITYLSTSEIDAEEEATVTFSWLATSGTHNITIIADYNKALNEINRDNNDTTKSITIAPPDLIVPSISWSPEDASIDEMVTFSVNITNQGSGKALNFHVAYFMDDMVLKSELISCLDAGASVNVTCTWQVKTGRHTFKAVANYNNYIIESDNTNNENTILFAPKLPDLAITSIIWSPHDMPAGNNVIFSIDIENQGLISSAPSRIAFYVDGVVAGYTDIGYMEAGVGTTEYFTWSASAGIHSISIILDSANQIVEIDEANNTRIINIPLPDLTVGDITFSPSDAQIGDTLVITANITNQGSGKTEISQIDCYIDGIKIASQELLSVEAGESVAKTFDWVAEAGIHTVRITIDTTNTVIEDNETNNEKEYDCAIATPDLIVEGMSWTTSNQLNNNEATLTITIKNIGTGPSEEFQVHYSLDSSPADIKNIASIPAGETVAFSFITILTTGQHTATIIADYNDVIIELDETNNESILSFSTIAPDLVIRTITYSPLDAGDGDTVTIIVKLENRGGAKATNVQLALYIDGSIVDYADIEEMDIAVITTIEFTWVATEGEHEITFFADADQTVFESNELNNTKSRTLSFEKSQAATNIPVNTATVSDGGFIESYWWLLLILAGLLVAIAFIPTLRSLRKK
jgi:subtilase family serine protease